MLNAWVRVSDREMEALRVTVGPNVIVKAIDAEIQANPNELSWAVLTDAGEWIVLHNPGVPRIVNLRKPCRVVCRTRALRTAIQSIKTLPGGVWAAVRSECASSDWYTQNSMSLEVIVGNMRLNPIGPG